MKILLLVFTPIGINRRVHSLKSSIENMGHNVELLFDLSQGKILLQQNVYCASIFVTGPGNYIGVNEVLDFRKNGIKTPIFVLSYEKGSAVRSAIINAGADDCMDDPLPIEELMIRINAIIRRSYSEPASLLFFGDVTINLMARKVMKGGCCVKLTKSEFILLETLILNTKRIIPRFYLEDRISLWGKDINSNVLDVHISNIRKKLGKDIIQTIKGQGYILSQ